MFSIWRKIAIQTFFTRNCWKRLIAEVECFCRYQTGRKNFCLGSNVVDKNWTSKLTLSSRAFAVAIIFQVHVRWKINAVKFNMWINWIQFQNSFLAFKSKVKSKFFFLLTNPRFSKFKRSIFQLFFSTFFSTFFFIFWDHSYK